MPCTVDTADMKSARTVSFRVWMEDLRRAAADQGWDGKSLEPMDWAQFWQNNMTPLQALAAADAQDGL